MRYLVKEDPYMWNIYILENAPEKDGSISGYHIHQGPGGFGIIISEKGTWMKHLIEVNYKEADKETEDTFKEWLYDAIFRGVEEITFR